MAISQTFLATSITNTENMITAYEAAVLALGTNTIQEYWIDTGQSRTKVVKADLPQFQKTIDSLYNRLATLCARRDGTGVVTVKPSW